LTSESLWWAEYAWLGGARTTADVLIEVKGEHLAAVTGGVSTPPDGAVRLQGLTLPGLANAHSHAFHRALRARTHDRRGTFWSWRDLMYGLVERLDPDQYRRLARAVFAEMVVAGFTAVGEFHYLHHGPGGAPYADPNDMGRALMEAAEAAGIRLTLLDTCYLAGGFETELQGPQLRFGDGDAERWAERVARLQPTEKVRLGAAVHSVRAVPAGAIAEVAAWTAERGWPLHAHVSEQMAEQQDCLRYAGATPLQVLAASGAVDSRFTAVHGTHFSPDDVALLGRLGAGCCLCPTTERDLGDGVGPAPDLRGAQVDVSIGTDSHAVIDGFEEARAIELNCRLEDERRGILEPADLMTSATTSGMGALGWDAGVIAPGKLADFVTISLDSLRTAGADPGSVATAVFAASAADVDVVVIGGRQVVERGSHLDIPDLGPELAKSVSALWS
jgi:formiminoglutamate deiminase